MFREKLVLVKTVLDPTSIGRRERERAYECFYLLFFKLILLGIKQTQVF